MCTSPNYIVYVGQRLGEPVYKFHPNTSYKKVLSMNLPFAEVPCGKCDACVASRAKAWADRCALESKNSKYNYFVTLTYNDDRLPKDGLVKKHLQLFMKRLRRALPATKIRFFGCGEYGGQTFRPHFHLILFNCPLDDLSEVFMEERNGRLIIHNNVSMDNRCLYSDTIHRCWDRKGNISVVPFTYATACYVAQYVNKKCGKNIEKFYKLFHCNPEYVVMSRRPGIGALSLNAADYQNDYIMVPGDGKAHIASIPRYFDKLMIAKYGDDWFNNNVRQSRIAKKFNRLEGYLNSSQNKDRSNAVLANKLKKLRRERQSL